jgi:thymidylate kinase
MSTVPRVTSPAEALLRDLAATPVRHALLHGWDRLDELADLDLAVQPADMALFRRFIAVWRTYRCVQIFRYEARSWGFVLADWTQTPPPTLVVDASSDYRCGGRIFLSSEDLLRGRKKIDGVWVAAPEVELGFLLLKKLYEKDEPIPGPQRVRMQRLVREAGEEGRRMCRRLFGAHWGQELWERVRAGRWEQVEQDRALLRRSCRRAALNTAPWWWAGEGPRVAERWFRPTGLLLAVLGPDGAGKATLAQKIVEDAGPVFRRVARVHFRPRRLHPGDPEASSRPHATPSYGFLRSLAKLVLYLADWWLGYLADIRPALARSTLVVCDRAYHDILVDPLRYRYGGPAWLARALGRFVPKPDLVLILDVPAEELVTRKRELPVTEAARQRIAYLSLAQWLPSALVVDGLGSLDEVYMRAWRAVLERLYERNLTLLGMRHG